MKVLTIVGTRPELIKLSRTIAELERHTEHVLAHTGQSYDHELKEIFFQELGIRAPDHYLDAVGANGAQTIGLVIARADDLLERVQPDAVLIYGDTNSGLAAISAKRRKIPIFHMEAGNRCFDQRVPEEINRKILDHICDVNLPLTEHARRYLLAEGLPPDRVIKTGSTMKEVLAHYMPLVRASRILETLELAPRGYFLVSAHREENVDPPASLRRLIRTLAALAETYDQPVLVSLHPRTRARLEALGAGAPHPLVRFSRPFGFPDYVSLQLHARCVLSDSGTLTEEASLLNLPAVMLRDAHERPEGMDHGVAIMSGLTPERVLAAVAVTLAQHDFERRISPVIEDYDVESVSVQVVRIILSYVDYVNRVVWGKPAPDSKIVEREAL